MPFKYFLHPERFAIWLEVPTPCSLCGLEKRCFDGKTFQGSEPMTAICEDCLLAGKMRDVDTYACEGDIEELQRQLHDRKPDKSTKAVSLRAGEITDDLERTTPPIFTHQNWYWPCAGSDYCAFLGYGSKSLFNRLAPDGDGLDFFLNTLYYTVEDLSDVDELWEESLPDLPITSLAAAKELETLFYVFVSQKKDKVVTVWDRR